MKITLPVLRVLVEDTVLQALEAGVRLPSHIEFRLPGKTFGEYFFEPAAGYHVRLQLGEPEPTLH
ncbi:MAG: hypothetical protein ACREMO_00995 [Gemmatimonadales bacterium]